VATLPAKSFGAQASGKSGSRRVRSGQRVKTVFHEISRCFLASRISRPPPSLPSAGQQKPFGDKSHGDQIALPSSAQVVGEKAGAVRRRSRDLAPPKARQRVRPALSSPSQQTGPAVTPCALRPSCRPALNTVPPRHEEIAHAGRRHANEAVEETSGRTVAPSHPSPHATRAIERASAW